MNRSKLLFRTSLACVVLLVGAVAIAQHSSNDPKTAGKPAMELPPGWTEADMQACMVAGTPGKQHEQLVKEAGTWIGKTTMWMYPGAQPISSQCTSTVTPIMDGRYVKIEMAGEMPGMGPFHGFGINGYDNMTGKYVSTWIDNHSTGIMNGTGQLSPDGKTLTWNYSYTCPINKKPATMREVETFTGPNSKTMEMWGEDPKSGKEFQMMKVEFTRK
jgi:hypothetical protein